MSNKDFFNSLKTTNMQYMLCDLHVHSIASADILDGDRYENLSAEEKGIIQKLADEDSEFSELDDTDKRLKAFKKKYVSDWDKYDALVAEKVDARDYLEFIVNRRDLIAETYSLSNGKDWALIAITDHNSYKFACKLSKQAWETKNENRIIVLPGLELDIEFEVIKNETAKAHVCIVFSPATEEGYIYNSIISACKKANNTEKAEWDFGETIRVHDLQKFIKTLRNAKSNPALCIAAHTGSSKGMQKETKTAFTEMQAKYAKLNGELLELPENCKTVKKNIEEKMSEISSYLERNKDANIETLKLIGRCGFDALQVSNTKDNVHYRCLHRFKPEQGRAVTILCSDAHRVQDVFNCGNNFVSYIKFPSFCSSIDSIIFFDNLKKAIRFGETRFKSVPMNQTNCFIKGIEISPETAGSKKFWPFEKDKFTIPFSQNLNCLIGGRGSGKSAMIEALAFLLESNQFVKNNKEDWYKRAVATLQGCKIKACWTSFAPQLKMIEKKSIFLERYFDFDENYKSVEFREINGQEVMDESVRSNCKIELYRMKDLEDLATDKERMRYLFDSICGDEIEKVKEEIKDVLEQLKSQHDGFKSILKRLHGLTKEDTPLRQYVTRKTQYDAVNTKDMRDKFDKLDKACIAKQVASQVKEAWDELDLENEISRIKDDTEQFFDDAKVKMKNEEGQWIDNVEIMKKCLFDKVDVRKSLISNMGLISTDANTLTSDIDDANNEIISKERDEKNSLESEGVPTGTKQRDSKKSLFDEAENKLQEYQDCISQLKTLDCKREALRDKLQKLVSERSSLREKTANSITEKLKKNLDASVLVIEADAQTKADKENFVAWIDKNMFPAGTKYKDKRIDALLRTNLSPIELRKILFDSSDDSSLLVVDDVANVRDGKIEDVTAQTMLEHAQVCYKFTFDDIQECESNESELPETIKKGITVFGDDENKIDAFLRLDEVVFDDVPEIRLMDRPKEMDSGRSIIELSPGQRCSAILPIILLNGNCPLIIDQPEDNLDNRLVREVIVNILASIKLQRQVIIATHNPNLPVLGDVEQAIILRADGQKSSQLQAIGDIDDKKVIQSITEIMEGGREAFQYRQSIYQNHWDGPIEQKM